VRIVTEQLKPGLPTSAADLSRMLPSDIVNYLKTHYLRPDWSYWQNMGVVLLQRAVWLSFDIQPSGSDDVVGNRLPADFGGYRIALRDALADDYRRRMQQCLSNIQAGKLPARRVNQGYLVRLDRFRQFAETLPTPFALSDEFPRIAPAAAAPAKSLQPEGPAPADDEKPLDTRERTTHLRIIRALIEIVRDHLPGNQLPESKVTSIIDAKVSGLGFDRPKQEAIRRAVKAARAEEPDRKPDRR
jgi:hypothetical protein